jgi:hypothetical protein
MLHYCSAECESRFQMVPWCARSSKSYKSRSKSSVERVQRAGARDVTQNFLCTRRGAGEQREREEFVALKYGVLCVPRCTSPIKSWGGREVGSAARAQHILAKRELYFSHFLVFPIIQHLRPRALGLRRLLLKHTAAENSYVFTHTHWMLLWRQSAVFIAYGIIACRTSAPFLCIKYRRIYYTQRERARRQYATPREISFLQSTPARFQFYTWQSGIVSHTSQAGDKNEMRRDSNYFSGRNLVK